MKWLPYWAIIDNVACKSTDYEVKWQISVYETDIYFSFMRRYYREPGQGERKK